jgi:HEAT repeat protein
LRKLKNQILSLLQDVDLAGAVAAITALPPRQAINPLFGFLYHGQAQVRWHAIAAMGAVTARLADQNMEAARVVLRRLMWNLNDESGGIGWGSPEAMGEIMACHEGLAKEYAAILISYLNPGGNYLEHEALQCGVLWGIGRLAHARPALVRGAADFLAPFFASPNAPLRGLAAWAAGPIRTPALTEGLKSLRGDQRTIVLFYDLDFTQPTVAQLAAAAIDQVPNVRIAAVTR